MGIKSMRSLDTGRLGAAMAGPGMDTRTWAAIAIALGESHVDADHGVFVDVQLLPTGEQITARVPADYAGKGFGCYAKIHKDDELVIVIPSGDPAEGAVVSNRLWSAADTPPQEAVDHPDDMILVVEKDKTLRIVCSGAGKIEVSTEDDVHLTTKKKVTVEAEGDVLLKTPTKATVQGDDTVTLDSPKVRLGGELSAQQALILGTAHRAAQKTMHTTLQAQLTALGTALGQLLAAISAYNTAVIAASTGILLPPAGVAIKAAAGVFTGASVTAITGPVGAVPSIAQAVAAIAAFEAAAAALQDFLSTVSKTE